jgi:hypothetical protein
MQYIGENDIMDILNDNLKNKYPNAKIKNIENAPYHYIIQYLLIIYSSNIDFSYIII